MEKSFPINPVMQCMSYKDTILSITFIRQGKKETREYMDVPVEVAYSWFYKQTVKDILSYYAKNIRKKYKLLRIIK